MTNEIMESIGCQIDVIEASNRVVAEMTGIVLSALDTLLNSNVEVAESDQLMQIYLFDHLVVPLLLLLHVKIV